jgi:hypothetical protein
MARMLLSTDTDDRCWGDAEPFSAPPRRRKTGGRQAGTPNKKTAMRRALISAALVSGKDPLTFFSEILRNEDNPLMLRFEAASILLPYTRPKLASMEARTGGKSHEDRLAEYQRLLDDEGSSADAPDALAAGKEDDWMQANLTEIAEVPLQTMLRTKF